MVNGTAFRTFSLIARCDGHPDIHQSATLFFWERWSVLRTIIISFQFSFFWSITCTADVLAFFLSWTCIEKCNIFVLSSQVELWAGTSKGSWAPWSCGRTPSSPYGRAWGRPWPCASSGSAPVSTWRHRCGSATPRTRGRGTSTAHKASAASPSGWRRWVTPVNHSVHCFWSKVRWMSKYYILLKGVWKMC